MQHVDEQRLEQDIQYRYEYLSEFIGFGPDDAAAIQASAPYVGPLIPELVEGTYRKLLGYTATARHFLQPQHGCDGPTPVNLAELSVDHPQIQFRKEHLVRYLMQILGRSYDEKMVQYLDMVGRIHTSAAGNPEIHVPLVQMNALMGLLADLLAETLLSVGMDPTTTARTLRAYQKLFWIQNDFISRYYC